MRMDLFCFLFYSVVCQKAMYLKKGEEGFVTPCEIYLTLKQIGHKTRSCVPLIPHNVKKIMYNIR